jgi:hypothetical protein
METWQHTAPLTGTPVYPTRSAKHEIEGPHESADGERRYPPGKAVTGVVVALEGDDVTSREVASADVGTECAILNLLITGTPSDPAFTPRASGSRLLID